jgi:hypothetical protein
LVHTDFRLKCKVLSTHPSSSLQFLSVYGHHQNLSILLKLLHCKSKLRIASSSFCPLTRELAPILKHRANYSVSWSFTGGRVPWTGDHLVARPLPKHRTTQAQKNTDTNSTIMPKVGFELATTASKRWKTVNASDRSATVTGRNGFSRQLITLILCSYGGHEIIRIKISICVGFLCTENS